MGTPNPLKHQTTKKSTAFSLIHKLLPCSLYALFPLLLFRLFLFPLYSSSSSSTSHEVFHPVTNTTTHISSSSHDLSHPNINTTTHISSSSSSHDLSHPIANTTNDISSSSSSSNYHLITNTPTHISSSSPSHDLLHPITNTTTHSSSSASYPSSPSLKEETPRKPCDYTNGVWVSDRKGPLYNSTTCSTIKEGQNCVSHGRPDTDYLFWRWQPNHCSLPRFDPKTFLRLLQGKHLAFVGDSMARNQLESLLCMLATKSRPKLVYKNGDDNKFRRWYFKSHKVTVSIFWSPFLVQGEEKSNNGPNHNVLYLDRIDEKWGSELNRIDMIVLSIGHWFLHPAVYYYNGSVLGCHYCTGLNHSEIGFYDVLRKALKTTFKGIIERKTNKKGINVILTTFSPSHFEGEWDKFGACPKTRPDNEQVIQGMDGDMRQVEIEEVEAVKRMLESTDTTATTMRIEALDVTKLSLMRPDGHPGPYMYPFPFANGVGDKVQNDCVHWCLPGPVDTWNEILLEMIVKRWRR